MFSIKRAIGSLVACTIIVFLGLTVFNSQSDRGYLFFVLVFTAAFLLMVVIAVILVLLRRK